MIRTMGRYIRVFMLLAAFLTANALQYTHDISHLHTNVDSYSSTDHHHADAGECALCWFVFHQMASAFVFDSLLPEVAVQEHVVLLHDRYGVSGEDGLQRLLGNKDPPQYL